METQAGKILVLLALFLSEMAQAHVKWFVDFDTTKPPQPIASVTASVYFWALLILSTTVIYLTSILDRRLPPVQHNASWQPVLKSLEAIVPQLMRIGVSLFFLTLSIWYPHIILTPELICENPYLRYIHLAIGLTAFYRRSSFLAGIGVLFLYAYSVDIYGIFHMLEYIVFIGTAVFLIQESLNKDQGGNRALELVRFTLCSGLAWGAIEKFAHPRLFFDLLNDHPYLAMGLDWNFFVLTAGFVEFCCAYHLYTGRTASYASAAVLAFFFFIAVIPFGFIDLVGHFLFIIPLLAITFSPRKKPVSIKSTTNVLFFLLGLIAYFVTAYGSYYVTHHHLS